MIKATDRKLVVGLEIGTAKVAHREVWIKAG